MKCRAPELKTPPQPWGVATRTGDRDRGTQANHSNQARGRGRGPRSGAGFGRFNRRGERFSRAGDRAELRRRNGPTRRSDPKDEPTGANDGGFSPRAANQPERIWNELAEAECGPVAGKTKRAGPARAFRAGPASDQGGGRWGGAASAGVFPGGRVWSFRGRQPRPGFSEPRRRPRAVGYVPLSPVSLFRTGQIEGPRVAPR